VELDLRLLHTSFENDLRRTAWIFIALAQGKVEALDEIPRLLLSSVGRPDNRLWGFLVQQVSEVRSPAAIPRLTALLHSGNMELARAAITALRMVHHPAAIPHLVAALDSPDFEVRYQAVMGLAELAPEVKAGPSMEIYQRDEAEFISVWKRWWKNQKQNLGQ
jgi:HEAT repeat protein